MRVWASATLGVVSAVAVAFAGVFLTRDGTVWWEWVVLGVGIVAGIASGVLIKRDSRAASQVMEGGAVGQQTASDKGTNISINADHGSAAAYHMGEVHVGQQRRRRKRKGS
ncbi:hypothetical protein F0Q45_23315 [Mycobacterium simiae]|uniref:DUF2530 domain-containing protein n=1 Tax=Mycobacterium simiae TaxID=1784 RepID=A0A5B1BFU9_MYCSI|nr:hypothetical protein [Mycobacterium simiae]KAA1246420.1 hypothetical protein F0Q45_23315 [Mycobacterium simiae]